MMSTLFGGTQRHSSCSCGAQKNTVRGILRWSDLCSLTRLESNTCLSPGFSCFWRVVNCIAFNCNLSFLCFLFIQSISSCLNTVLVPAASFRL
jgi:hypothetical protein